MAKWQTTSMADVDRLTKMSFNYLIKNFSKFSQMNKIKVALKLAEKFIDAKENDNDEGNKYITNIINSFNGNGRNLTEEQQGRVKTEIEATETTLGRRCSEISRIEEALSTE